MSNMVSERVVKIREKRDAVIENWSMGLYLVVALAIVHWLFSLEQSDQSIIPEIIVGYGSLTVIAIITVIEYENTYIRTVMNSARSIIALAIMLIVLMPVIVLLHGITGYKKYAMREARRIGKMEESRWKERL